MCACAADNNTFNQSWIVCFSPIRRADEGDSVYKTAHVLPIHFFFSSEKKKIEPKILNRSDIELFECI